MASLVLGAIGGFFFGPVGYLVGSFLGNLLDPPKQEGPRLTDLKLQASQYGNMLPRHWGTNRLAGTVIWQTDLVEHKHESGGKGGPQTTTYTYTASFAIALCEGPMAAILRIWADKRLIWDLETSDDSIPCRVYLGTSTQTADPTIEAALGAGNVPGFRDTCYVVFADYDLSQFFNRIPNLEFEVAQLLGGTSGPIFEEYLTIDNVNNPAHTEPVVLTQWLLHGGAEAIRASGRTVDTAASRLPNGVNTWDGDPTLAWSGVEPLHVAGDAWPQYIDTYGFDPTQNNFASEIAYFPLGKLINANGVVGCFWGLNIGPGSPVIGNDGNGYGGAPLDCTVYPALGTDFFFEWGLPGSHGLITAITTADNRSMFIFTDENNRGSTGEGLTATNWFEIRNDQIVRRGTCGPSAGISRDPLSTNRYGVVVARCFENNREWLWSIQRNFGGPGHGQGGAVSLGRIDPDTLIYDAWSPGGHCFTDTLSPTNVLGGTASPSLIAIGTGRCGVLVGNAVAIFRRTVPGSDEVTLAKIVSDISVLAGLTTDQIDVTELTDLVPGYTIASQMTARNMIQPLRNAYFFDGVESDGIVKFPKRTHGPVVTIPQDDLAAFESGSGNPPALLQTERTQEVDLPMRITVNYLNQGADYQQGSQYAQRQVTASQSVVALDLPIVLPDASAKAMAVANLLAAWIEREKLTFYTSRKYAYLEPTDVVIAQGRQMRIITREETSTKTIKFEALGTLAAIYETASGIASAPGGQTPPPVPPPPVPSTLALLLDIPLIVDSDGAVPDGFYSAMRPSTDAAWPGAILEKSIDGGVSYAPILTDSAADTLGTTTSVLGSFAGGNVFDETNSVAVSMTSGGTLSGASESAVLNGANMALVGSEVIQYKNATLTGAGQYALSGLLRGRRGTEWAIGGHASGERFVALPVDRVALPFSEMYALREYKAVTGGQAIADAVAQDFVNSGQSLRPYAPVQLGGGCDPSGNVVLNWTRRTRLGGAWQPFADVPLSEASEAYVVQIWNADYSLVAHTIFAASPTMSYGAADQISDFGALQETIFFTVAQLGAAGVGEEARGSCPGGGSTNDDPLFPVPPFQSSHPGAGTSSLAQLTMYLTWGALGTANPSAPSTLIGAFGCTQVLVVRFDTPSSTANGELGVIQATSYSATGSAQPLRRRACLSTSAGDFSGAALGVNSLVYGSTPGVRFSVGTNAAGCPQLATSTTYYFNLINDDGYGVCTCTGSDCPVLVKLVKPAGL